MSQNLCKWFSKTSKSKNKITPNIPELTAPAPAPAPAYTYTLKDCVIPPVPKPRPLSTLQPQKNTIVVFTDGSTINNGKRS